MQMTRYLEERKDLFDRKLLSYLPRGEKYTKKIYDAAKYSLMTGGKRIRPILAMAACEAVSGSYRKALPLACALEMIHTYTLIHDDLPAMDDDDMRRGKPTTHIKYGEDIAILAGDLLNTLAFEVIARSYGNKSGRLITELAGSLGINGVVGGQVADILAEGRKMSLKELEFIAIHKTAYLFIASVRCGAIAGGASTAVINRLGLYAKHMGLAFQIIDDILDHRPGMKNGYPAVMGLEKSSKLADKELNKALQCLPAGKKYDVLRELAVYLSKRKV